MQKALILWWVQHKNYKEISELIPQGSENLMLGIPPTATPFLSRTNGDLLQCCYYIHFTFILFYKCLDLGPQPAWSEGWHVAWLMIASREVFAEWIENRLRLFLATILIDLLSNAGQHSHSEALSLTTPSTKPKMKFQERSLLWYWWKRWGLIC